ncbi:hypothetical protein [Yinghuangia sp. YIM S09857]|uniref:hypothetical protein n=1 Tax=Yinghuangia sp. YIM S09857 TaxID=3436929 RepID=UPI003F5395A2
MAAVLEQESVAVRCARRVERHAAEPQECPPHVLHTEIREGRAAREQLHPQQTRGIGDSGGPWQRAGPFDVEW